jgi:hypothetical protein
MADVPPEYLGTEFGAWLVDKPLNETGKVDGRLLLEESRSRGYCVCPRDIRRMIDFSGLTCGWCGQPEARASWEFYYLHFLPTTELAGGSC